MSDQLEPSTSSVIAKKFRYQQVKSVKHLYLAKKLADVHFSFVSHDGTATPILIYISAHKILLAADSDVFEKMFCGKVNQCADIRVSDVCDAAFNEFLQFFFI